MAFDQMRSDTWTGQHFSTLWTPPLQNMTELRSQNLMINSTDSGVLYSNTISSAPARYSMPISTCQSPLNLIQPSGDHDPNSDFITPNYIDPTTEKVQDWLHDGTVSLPSRAFQSQNHSQPVYDAPFEQPSASFLPFNNPAALMAENQQFGRLHITFLPAEGRSSIGTTKFGRLAEIIRLQDGTVKLFAERGRVIDTRITFEPWENRLTGDQLRLRFTPYSSCAGVIKPVVGSHHQLQKAPCSQTSQICFIQLGQREDVNPGECFYEYDSENYLSMVIPLTGFRGIYPLVFPFHNSQCLSTYRKTVYIRISVIRPDGSELASKHFELVSCASPLRDFQRFQARLTGKRRGGHEQADVGRKRKSNSAGNDLDISPVSSGFASSGSPIYCGWLDDDSRHTFNPEQTTQCIQSYRALDQSGSTETKRNLVENFTKDISVSTTPMERSTRSPEIDRPTDYPNEFGEYVIKTKSYRIYCVLSAMEKKLSSVYGQLDADSGGVLTHLQ